ncbi:hypothetical protein CO157_05775 [Candidatus Peregrinibacteria bacterium CG_4_9_14_3_um_filter_49_12]|nr:MAG: hypothetical protein CO157_05775 [Candidatus Peregrinibacteria bacterium CG_4_9_14_3_um_filter_49_12]
MAMVAYAQELPAPETPASPAELSQEELDWEARIARTDGFRISMLQTIRGMELFHAFVEKNRNEVMANRKKCREDLRKANRDTKFATTVRCFGKELQLGKELAEKKQQFAESISGVDELRRAEVLQVTGELLEAMDAVSTGISRDVFRDEDELLEAKKNLHKTYGIPVLLSFSRLEADRTRTWVAHIMVRLLITTQNTEMGPEAFEKASEALGCYEEAESYLEAVLASERYENAVFAANQSRSHLADCGDLLEATHALQREFEQMTPTEE